MKNFLKKYIGIIVILVMIGLLTTGHIIKLNNPNIRIIFYDIPIWYLGFSFILIVIYIEIRLLKKMDNLLDKFKIWINKKKQKNDE